MTKPVLVVGATRGVGRQALVKLLAADVPVRVLVRDFKSARAALGDEVEYIAGDVRQPETLPPALAGVEAVICTIGASYTDSADIPETVDYEGVRHLVEASKAAGIEHFVLVSWLGVTHPDNELNKLVDNVLQWKLKGEETLRNSGLTYTIIRPGELVDEVGGTQKLVVNQGDQREFTGKITREDVAELAVQALNQPAARGVTFEVIAQDGGATSDFAGLFAGLKKD